MIITKKISTTPKEGGKKEKKWKREKRDKKKKRKERKGEEGRRTPRPTLLLIWSTVSI